MTHDKLVIPNEGLVLSLNGGPSRFDFMYSATAKIDDDIFREFDIHDREITNDFYLKISIKIIGFLPLLDDWQKRDTYYNFIGFGTELPYIFKLAEDAIIGVHAKYSLKSHEGKIRIYPIKIFKEKFLSKYTDFEI